jgi:hypothetical protein
MSSHRVPGSRLMTPFGILLLVGAGCTYNKPPSFHIDATVPGACHGQQAGNHTIPVDDFGGVGAGDTCVAISRSKHHSLKWTAKSPGSKVSIVFLLSRGQKPPFDQMACGPADQAGTKLCVLQACPEDCKTTFRADYQVSEPQYYYYSPAVANAPSSAAKAGADAGIRIDP